MCGRAEPELVDITGKYSHSYPALPPSLRCRGAQANVPSSLRRVRTGLRRADGAGTTAFIPLLLLPLLLSSFSLLALSFAGQSKNRQTQ